MGVKTVRGELPNWLSGYGSGYGDGDGYGSGSGSGSGYGYGYGSGYGDGDGYGSGYGDGDGYGSGYGDGDGHGYYWLAALASLSKEWTEKQRGRLSELRKAGARLAFWKSGQSGEPVNGGSLSSSDYARPGMVQEIKGPLEICSRALHATLNPPKWRGDRTWVVALFGEVQEDEDKLGALRREIIAEIKTT